MGDSLGRARYNYLILVVGHTTNRCHDETNGGWGSIQLQSAQLWTKYDAI